MPAIEEDPTEKPSALKLSPGEVATFGDVPLYDPWTVRTLFLEFEQADGEKELEVFQSTDVDTCQ